MNFITGAKAFLGSVVMAVEAGKTKYGDFGLSQKEAAAKIQRNTQVADDSPTMCIFISGDNWDHYSLFALTEINSGMYQSTLGNMTFQHKFLYADPKSSTVEGDTQAIFSFNYESCHIFVGPGWTVQLEAIGEWAGVVQKPIVTGTATSPIFTEPNYNYVSRTIPSDTYVLRAFVSLIREYEFELINIVYVDDRLGQRMTAALYEMSKGLFHVESIHSIKDVDDVDGITSALDALEDSSTSVTFLGLNYDFSTFLNMAGQRGMHENHLWLSPNAVEFQDKLDPPSTGGIWSTLQGKELTEESPLVQRYLAKDPTPHIEALEYGFPDTYDTMSFYGAYTYEAVLAAANGLATATNISDGAQVLKEIRNLSLRTDTGALQMDENGDRVGARIPIYFITPEGTAEQFALYYNETTEFLRVPMWPDGSTKQPENFGQEVDPDRSVMIIAVSVSCGLAVVLAAALFFLRKSKHTMQKQQEYLTTTKAELELHKSELHELKNAIQSSIGTTKYGDAVAHVDALIEQETSYDEKEKLKLIKTCLMKGDDDRNSLYIPQNLNEDDVYIMKEFAGMTKPSMKKLHATRHVYSGPSMRNLNDFATDAGTFASAEGSLTRCLPEFRDLTISEQTKLYELLSFDNMKRWDFNVFDVAGIDEKNTLLFVSWAVLCSPYSQIAMAKELKQAGVEVAQNTDFPGYDFTDLDFTIDGEKLINYIRLIQEGYKEIPYHNRVHAADVVQTLNSLLQMAKFPAIDREDLFFILISAVVHDVKHPGRNNAFQVNCVSELALDWNDISVLESEHISYAWKCLLKEKDSNFMNAEPAMLHEARKKMIEAVLHTDMTKHFAGVSSIKTAAAGKNWDDLDQNIQWHVLTYMLHMADISNPAKGDAVSQLWTDRCLDEFFQQGDKEREMGVPISPNCDRNTTKRPDSQIGFIKFVIKPAYEVLGEIIPAVKDDILPIIESNLAYWERQKCLEDGEMKK